MLKVFSHSWPTHSSLMTEWSCMKVKKGKCNKMPSEFMLLSSKMYLFQTTHKQNKPHQNSLQATGINRQLGQLLMHTYGVSPVAFCVMPVCGLIRSD